MANKKIILEVSLDELRVLSYMFRIGVLRDHDMESDWEGREEERRTFYNAAKSVGDKLKKLAE